MIYDYLIMNVQIGMKTCTKETNAKENLFENRTGLHMHYLDKEKAQRDFE